MPETIYVAYWLDLGEPQFNGACRSLDAAKQLCQDKYNEGGEGEPEILTWTDVADGADCNHDNGVCLVEIRIRKTELT